MKTVALRPCRPQSRSSVPESRRHVVLIGFQDHANLGMGYLAAVLRKRNLLVDLVDFREGPTAIAARVLAADPLIVGFSLIFQYFLPDFVDLGAHPCPA